VLPGWTSAEFKARARRIGASPGLGFESDRLRLEFVWSRALGTVTAISKATHLVMTRFNVQISEDSTTHLDEAWLRRRMGLFQQFTAPSVCGGIGSDSVWLLLVNDRSPTWLVEQLHQQCPSAEILSLTGTWDSRKLRDELKNRGWGGGTTTRVDSDDVLLKGFFGELGVSVRRRGTGVHTFPIGYQLVGGRFYWRCYVQNPFISLHGDASRTVFDLRHWDLRGERVHRVSYEPRWLQVIHGENLANEVRGVRTSGRRASTSLAEVGATAVVPVRVGWRREAARNAARLSVEGLRSLNRLRPLAIGGRETRGPT
jgi:hypothetical protein